MQNVIAIDTETDLISPGRLAPPITCASTAISRSGTFETGLHGYADHLRKVIPFWIGTEAHLIVGHNFAYDAAVIMAEWPELISAVFGAYDADRVTDTMIREQLINIANGCLKGKWGSVNGKRKFIEFSYALDAVVKRRLGRELDKDEEIRLKYGELRNVPVAQWPERFRKYATDDATASLELYLSQEAEKHLLEDQFNQTRAGLALQLMSCWGMITDPVAIEKLTRDNIKQYEKAKSVVTRAGILRKDGSRDTGVAKAYMKRWCERKGIQIKLTDKGNISLDEDACLGSGSLIMKKYTELTSLKAVMETHIPKLWKGCTTGAPIQASFKTLQDTGRTSCSMGDDKKNQKKNAGKPPRAYGYQTQNIRKLEGIRECFVPRPGFVFVESDYTALELHTWAQVCLLVVGHSKMAEALNTGADPHSMLGAILAGTDYDSLRKGYKDGDDWCTRMRSDAKEGNFGFPGGMGLATFMETQRTKGRFYTEAQAKVIRDGWFKAWPEARPYFDWVNAQLNAGGGKATICQFYTNRYRGGLGYSQAANSPFQGLGADAAKKALYAVVRETFIGRMKGAHVVNFVHDSITTEVPEECAHEYAEIQSEIMVREAYTLLPDVKPKVDTLLCRRLSKKAKAIRDENGRLIPWDWEHSK